MGLVNEDHAELFNRISLSGLGSLETLEATYDLARIVLARHIPGDFVECGVYAGAQVAVMARAIMDNNPERAEAAGREPYGLYGGTRVHLFDSFEGLPAATERDQELFARHGSTPGESAVSIDGVRENMKSWGVPDQLLVYHPGWFADTVPAFQGAIAFLRLDGDLYSSTKVCLEHLYPRVSSGGWVVVDDYNLTGCREAVSEIVVPAPVCWRIPTK